MSAFFVGSTKADHLQSAQIGGMCFKAISLNEWPLLGSVRLEANDDAITLAERTEI